MKTIIALMLFCCIVWAEANAQTTKGSFMIGGSANIGRHKSFTDVPGATASPSSTIFSASPTVGYFPINNLMTGIRTTGTTSWQKNGEYYKDFGFAWSVGPLIRYYFLLGKKFAVFPEVAALYHQTGNRYRDNYYGNDVSFKTKSITYDYRAGAGATWFVTPNMAIEGVVAYLQSNYKSSPTSKKTVYGNIGIQFYLPKRN